MRKPSLARVEVEIGISSLNDEVAHFTNKIKLVVDWLNMCYFGTSRRKVDPPPITQKKKFYVIET